MTRKFDHFPHGSCSFPAPLQVEGHPSICVRKVTEGTRGDTSHKFLWIAQSGQELFPALRKPRLEPELTS